MVFCLEGNPYNFSLYLDKKPEESFELFKEGSIGCPSCFDECKKGDQLLIKETKFIEDELKDKYPPEYTGRVLTLLISTVLRGGKRNNGIQKGWVLIAFKRIK